MIIAIEGTDGVGKGTQSQLLANHLNKIGKPTSLISLPDYESTTGQAVKKYLAGNLWWFGGADSYIAASLFAANRVECMVDYFKGDPDSGEKSIIFNRYVLSNAAYQSYRFTTGEKQRDFVEWVLDLEFSKFKLSRPDLTIILDLPVDEAIKQMQKRQGDYRDIHEANTAMLQYCRKVYLSMAYLRMGELKYYVVDCYDHKSGCIRSIDDIHEEIALIVHKTMVDLTK